MSGDRDREVELVFGCIVKVEVCSVDFDWMFFDVEIDIVVLICVEIG